ncbi:hypothetical protein K438DRAFT_345506 [Mycena galopus ATCC 62051]|nr:hypothetical protein K438DRAFT_345506 [Mycena galopus ATCC 62051]
MSTTPGSEFTIPGSQFKVADCAQRSLENERTILTLPNEITSEIFVHSLPRFPSYQTSTVNPTRAPMLLLRVCRAWRSIALSTPRLWTNLELDFDLLPQALFDAANMGKFIEDCVTRSGACPLSLFLRASDEREEEGWQFIPNILERLSSRLQVLELDAAFDCFPRHVSSFPLLRMLSLSLRGVEDEDEDEIENPIQIFISAPQLRELDIRLHHPSPYLFDIHYGRLTRFNGDGLSFAECVHVLRLAPFLVSCSLQSVRSDLNTASITHTNLKSFEIFNTSNELLRFLTFPFLDSLGIYMHNVDEDLLQFISRLPPLRNLTVDELPFESLSKMVTLTDLRLFTPASEYMAEFFGFFDRTTHQAFLPRLRVLELNYCPPHVDAALVDALSSRCGVAEDGAARLESFHQTWSDDTPADALDNAYEQEGLGIALEELVKNGMEIYIGRQLYVKDPGAWLFNQPKQLWIL